MARDLRLFIGNKNYSSWSFRPWIALKVKGIAFAEELVPFDFDNGNQAYARFSPSGKVPVLKDGETTIWDSLSILEYLAEIHPEAGLWPDDAGQRAVARSISAEMHSGFAALRHECPMNMRRKRGAITISDACRRDVARIAAIWTEQLSKSGGPFLFGEFTAADAMFAPVVNRFDVYELSDAGDIRAYMSAIQSFDAWSEWEAASRAEPWTVEAEEV